jgi:uncharacterized protein YgbK (DUF1537 family)
VPNIANVEVGIVADDLTGALDSAAAFCAPDVLVTVELWDRQPAEPGELAGRSLGAQVVSVAAATRDLPAEAGEPLLRGALESILLRSPRLLLLKVDSQLRGHPARDVALALRLAPSATLAIVAPAFPGHGRTTIGGIHRVGIHRVGEADAGTAVPALFEKAGLSTRPVGLEAVRKGTLRETLATLRDAGVRVAAIDAETDDDLRAIATAGRGLPDVLWVGSAGLAAALAAPFRSGEGTSEPLPLPELSRTAARPDAGATRILVVAGSASPQTARQIAELVSAGAEHVIVSGERSGPAFDAGVAALRSALARRAAAVLSTGVTASGIDEQHGRWAECVARTAAAALEGLAEAGGAIDGLVFSGGETMAATCRALGIHSLEVHGETELGIPYAISRGSVRVPVVSKAGTFGDDEALVRAVSRLRHGIRNHPASSNRTADSPQTTGSTEGANR